MLIEGIPLKGQYMNLQIAMNWYTLLERKKGAGVITLKITLEILNLFSFILLIYRLISD